jgi:hypothetical protein
MKPRKIIPFPLKARRKVPTFPWRPSKSDLEFEQEQKRRLEEQEELSRKSRAAAARLLARLIKEQK